MSPMEQALRDEIAWHEAEINWMRRWCEQDDIALRFETHCARLSALTAALPAPGEISQAQIRDMREALQKIREQGYVLGLGAEDWPVADAEAAIASVPEPPR